VRESGNVISLVLEPADGQPVAAALPGQFVVLRLGPTSAPALMRSYSLSGEPSAVSYRVSVKREAHGAASAYIDDELRVGDIVHASAARGSFTLRPGDNTRCVVECRDRSDTGARDASRAGRRSIDEGNLVAIRNP
jgi:ferredoxin-NADP reductase